MTSPRPSLPPDLRNRLAKVVISARRVAEAAARHALKALAVERSASHKAMSLTDQGLRNRLRARGRQLADRRDPQARTQEIGRLAHEVAYEQWHRMLFARFLAENGLLLEPDHGVPVSAEECAELAQAKGTDRWTVAGGFAARMLPGVFRQDDPVLDVVLAPEARLELEELLESLPEAVFLAGDALGWTYQYWQASRKHEINRSEVKIGAEELPSVTQLFTERYMVLFLFHNTIGAWRARKVLDERGGNRKHETEESLRRAVRISAGGGYDFSHLRFVRDETQAWHPAAGGFDGWPREAAELRVFDPCCGSGHFLVEGLELLTRLRMEDEGLSVKDAVRCVLAKNLHGLEIDARCTQIAMFNLAFSAWRMVGHPFDLPRLNVCCSGLAPNCTESEWMEVAARVADATGMGGKRDLFGSGSSLATNPLQEGMAVLHKIFQDAPELGSLINPGTALRGDLFRVDFSGIREVLSAVLEQDNKRSSERYERMVVARDLVQSAKTLSGTYTLVITNVPYLLRRKQSHTLRSYIANTCPDSKNDLATAFVERSFQWLGENGTTATVSPQAWLSLTSYRVFRRLLLQRRTWNMIARLGPGAFGSISGHVVNVILGILSADLPSRSSRISVMASSQRTADGKAREVMIRSLTEVVQSAQLTNIDARITLAPPSSLPLLMLVADYGKGSMTGDRCRFVFYCWEAPMLRDANQIKWLNSPASYDHWTGRSEFCKVPLDSPMIREQRGSGINGQRIFGRFGVGVNKISLRPLLYAGEVFDDNVGPICPNQSTSDLTTALWAYVSSPEYASAVREIDQGLKITAATLVKVPFDLEHWQRIAAERYPNGLPEPYSDDPTQWLFHGHPCGSVVWDEDAKHLADGSLRTNATVLQIAVARLLGYRWPAEHDSEMRLADESRDWIERCRQLDHFADRDGIVCIPAVGGERPAQDRLRELLRTAYGDCWSAGTERALLAAAQGAGNALESIDGWLRDRFFEQHCKLFRNRPFVWHIWDGRRDGFHALVNYHRLAAPDGHGRRTLESLAYRYLGSWIEQQRDGQREGKAGADARLAAALGLQKQLEGILLGEPPLDIFVRWRPLAGQPIGWEPELDDGVRMNIRPFMRAQLPSGGRVGAGILRWKPNVKWGKDKGKEPERRKDTGETIRSRKDFPWFWGCPGAGSEAERTDFRGNSDFDGNRWNDLHYTRAVKEAARAEAAIPSTRTKEATP